MRKMRKAVVGAALLLLLAPEGFARLGQKDEKNESDMLIKAARFLEQKPFDKEAKDVRAWAIKWLIATDKVTVTVAR